MRRKRVGFFGNCQADAIATILTDHKSFIAKFEILPVKPVYLMSLADRHDLVSRMEEFDVFVSQDVSSERYHPADAQTLFAAMRPGTEKITFPVMWFDAYFPDMFYLKGRDGLTIHSGPCDYHSRTIVQSYKQGLSVSAAVDRLHDEIDPQSIEANLEKNFVELRDREARLDIKVCNTVGGLFGVTPLFYTMNHPSLSLLALAIDRLLSILGMPLLSSDVIAKHSAILSDIQWRINPSVARYLSLKFPTRCDYAIGQRLGCREFVERYYAFYRKTGVLDNCQPA